MDKENKIEYDFYCVENNTHFNREKMTPEEAENYAKEYNLTFKKVKENLTN